MKISYRWLREMIPTSMTAEEASAVLTATGLEVEGIEQVEDIAGGLKGLVVGRVLACEQHPNADRLRVCQVDIGSPESPLSIVCGADNVRTGLDVIVATVGATLHPIAGEPFKIKKGKIRGEASMGMICAEDEIGVGNSHAGIIELKGTWPPGTSAAEVFGLGTDEVIEIGLTPNRTDGMSHWGVARDLAAGLVHETVKGTRETPTLMPSFTQAPKLDDGDLSVTIDVEDGQGAPRYCGCILDGVQVGPSPDWVQKKLHAIGVTPINNIVDATNYVLHEMGTPLHAFDADKIGGQQVKVRRAKSEEAFTTLDGVKRTLDPTDLVIADADRPMCLAGVFGGETSGVTDDTNRVFLESAWFDPVSVRKTARRHGLSTDASFRFERGVDPALTWRALERAAQLITEWAGGEVVGEAGKCVEAGRVPGPATISLPWKQLHSLIGERIPAGRVESILTSLDIEILESTDAAMTLRVPAYRADVTRPADVVEEILRIHGFDRVPLPKRMAITLDVVDGPNWDEARLRMSEVLVSRGFSEIMNNSLTRATDVETFLAQSGKEDPSLNSSDFVEMLNPLSSDLAVMRQTLLFQGLETIARNRNVQKANLRLFELGRTYKRKSDGGFLETEMLGLWMSGDVQPENWKQKSREVELQDLKGDAEALLQTLGIASELIPMLSAEGYFLEGLQWETRTRGDRGKWVASGEVVGRMGRVHPDASALKDLAKVPIFYAEFDVQKLVMLMERRLVRATNLPKFPSVRRDLSLLVPQHVTFEQMASSVRSSGGKLVQKVGLFDVYSGDGLPEGMISYAISITLQDESKTLNDKQIDKTMQRILGQLQSETGASLRQQTSAPQA
ncbi:MAG: phenylalanine--tRNA ligase subunit beta [Flavobacteriales bacterium]